MKTTYIKNVCSTISAIIAMLAGIFMLIPTSPLPLNYPVGFAVIFLSIFMLVAGFHAIYDNKHELY